jgi:replicative DNA helicase
MTATAKRRPPPPPKANLELLDATPPHNLDAERGVLGSILLLSDCLDDVALIVKADDFHDAHHALLYRRMLELYEKGKRVDITLLADVLKKNKSSQIGDDGKFLSEYAALGGAPFIADLARSVPTAANAAYYATIVRDAATLRSLAHAGTAIVQAAYANKDAEAALDKAEESVLAVRDNRTAGTERISTAADLLMTAMLQIDAGNSERSKGLETHYCDLDRMVSILPQELIILAARPSMGKSALALNIAENVSIDSGKRVLFVSLEMSASGVAYRLLASRSRVDSTAIRENRMTPDERKRLVEASAVCSQAKLLIDETPTRTVSQIAAVARREKRRRGLDLLVIDYLQLVEPIDHKVPREQQVAQISKRLKGIARELKVPVLVLAQLNRESDKTGRKPRLSDLRESGAIEQDADVVMFIHREEYYMTPDEAISKQVNGIATVIVAKQRDGATGEITLTWQKNITRFDNYHRPIENNPNYESSFAEYSA